MSITERAAQVLHEIKAELAWMENEVTAGPWKRDTCCVISRCSESDEDARSHVDGGFYRIEVEGRPSSCDFIASARTVCPKSLRCLKTAIEGFLIGCDTRNGRDFATAACESALTALITQWNENK